MACVTGCDHRWRPMRTAPKDGTVVELLVHGDQVGIGHFDAGEWWAMGTAFNPDAWRPAHPEWQEEPSDG